ncbi:5'/3'-nucleotidase SurE [Duganella sp. CF402]|uniref:5'/3'-nucleotidase SurE n=1 Tax=unclassified Duganella TaxID=2636909 RepID=UPI0008B7F819|nr:MULTISPECIES: 5'/3'-nucleotidase SurE [unclassified Duganella]RZT11048.1 5'/3'-nucleotidase SurE [Duganella sp. BK701]SEK83992.1 5'/3'-nucleotidase SurE [Duganella sp. CF402]
MKRLAMSVALALCASPAFALNIVLANDDGLTSNIKALYEELKAAGHSVIVSVPCTGQSGRSAAIVMYSTTLIIPDNDKTQVEAEGGCHNGAAPTGAPAVGPFTKSGYTNGDYNYVHGTPVMATMYGLDVLATARWGKAPDLVLSGPNEGQNVGKVVINSGTIGNAQFAAGRGIPAIALSAGTDTVDNSGLAAAGSRTVAQLTVKLIAALQAKAGSSALLPTGTALNVNFPNGVTSGSAWSFSRIGTYDTYALKFSSAAPWGLSGSLPPAATADQAEDEAVVYKTKIAVSAMQVGYEHRPAGQQWLRLRLRDLFAQ